MFHGYHLSGTTRGCAKLIHAIDSWLDGKTEPALQVLLDPVPPTVLAGIARGSKSGISFRELLLTAADETAFQEYGDAIELCITRNDLESLRRALEAIRRGVGDFEILDGELWMWWAYCDKTGQVVVCTDPEYNPGP